MGYEPKGMEPGRGARALLGEVLADLGPLSQEGRASVLLRVAAELVETAAYELAGTESAPRVARVILASAEVARLADAIARTPGPVVELRRVS